MSSAQGEPHASDQFEVRCSARNSALLRPAWRPSTDEQHGPSRRRTPRGTVTLKRATGARPSRPAAQDQPGRSLALRSHRKTVPYGSATETPRTEPRGPERTGPRVHWAPDGPRHRRRAGSLASGREPAGTSPSSSSQLSLASRDARADAQPVTVPVVWRTALGTITESRDSRASAGCGHSRQGLGAVGSPGPSAPPPFRRGGNRPHLDLTAPGPDFTSGGVYDPHLFPRARSAREPGLSPG